jgi:hypothetical protein
VQTIPVKSLREVNKGQKEEPAIAPSPTVAAQTKRPANISESSAYAKEKRRKLERREQDFLLR